MAVLDSNNVKNRPDFAANSAALKKLVDELKANLAVVAQVVLVVMQILQFLVTVV